jgi:hypothetical protein
MIDGRTVGEVVPKSASAKEIADLWVYVQDRLSRLMKDPAFVPEFRAAHLSVSPLTTLDAAVPSEEANAPAASTAAPIEPPEQPATEEIAAGAFAKPWEGAERHALLERRQNQGVFFGGVERRTQGSFGRRASDQLPPPDQIGAKR